MSLVVGGTQLSSKLKKKQLLITTAQVTRQITPTVTINTRTWLTRHQVVYKVSLGDVWLVGWLQIPRVSRVNAVTAGKPFWEKKYLDLAWGGVWGL